MKPSVFCVLAAFLLTACQTKSTDSSESEAAKRSDFDAVIQHLDVGAKALHFEDHAGQRETWIGILDLIQAVVEVGKPYDDIDSAGVVDDLGLCSAAASGRSLMQDGDHWLARHYSHHPDGLPEVLGLWGKEKPFAMGSLPASTEVAFECRLDTRDVPEMVRGLAKHIGGLDDVESVLKQKLPIGLTVDEALLLANMDVLMGVEFANTTLKQMPVAPKAFILKMRADVVLVTACKSMFTKHFGEAKDMGGRMGWEGPILDQNIQGLNKVAPVILIEGDDTLIIVSSRDQWEIVKGSGDTLEGNVAYQSATNHFPKSGNMQVYLSPKVAAAAREWVGLVMKETGKVRQIDELLEHIMPGKPWSFCMVCGETGVLTMAEMPFALDVSASTAMALVPGNCGLFIGARYWKKGSDRAGCILNIRNIQQAIRSHQGMRALNMGDEINWDDIVGPDKFMEHAPKCPGGGTYTFARSIPEHGELACTCSHAEHEPPDHKDW